MLLPWERVIHDSQLGVTVTLSLVPTPMALYEITNRIAVRVLGPVPVYDLSMVPVPIA